jgi:hypothetical protein
VIIIITQKVKVWNPVFYFFIFCYSSSRLTLHVADLASLRALDEQISEGNNSTFNGFKNYFLINIPSHLANDTEKIAELFADSPLSYNSLTFAFFIANHTYGKSSLNITK